MSHAPLTEKKKMIRRNKLSIRALVAAMGMAGLMNLPASAADDSGVSVDADIRPFLFGQIIFDYYVGNYFSSMNGILSAKSKGYFDDSTDNTELLLGDLYTQLNMPQQAESVFSRIIKKDTLSTTKQQTWLREGRLHYNQGHYAKAESILGLPRDTLSPEVDTERRVLLSNIYMARNDFAKARDILQGLSLGNKFGAYAYYNMGVAHLRANRSPEGVKLLETLVQLPGDDPEILAIKDRAALALGVDFLQHQQPEKAREALLNIRIDGPFSNQALLALGYVHYSRTDYKKALSFWLELLRRNPADPAVLEAMMLAPRAYEELKAYPQAVYGYRLAAESYRKQLKLLEKIDLELQQDGWLEQLGANARNVSLDPMATVDTISTSATPEAAFLYKLFASHSFNETFKEYILLQRLDFQLAQQTQSAQAFSEQAASHQIKIRTNLPSWKASFSNMASTNTSLQNKYADIRKRMKVDDDMERFTDEASFEDANRLKRLNRLEKSVAALPNTPGNALLKERMARVKGIVLFSIANNAPLAREQMLLELSELDEQVKTLQSRINGVEQLLKDNEKRLADPLPTRLATSASNLARSQSSLLKVRDEHAQSLRKQASEVLAKERTLLNTQLAESLLAIARLQDAAATRELDELERLPVPAESSGTVSQ